MPRPKKVEVEVEEVPFVPEVTEIRGTEAPPALAPDRPKMTDPEWNDWVLNQLRSDERDPEGNPTVDGLRRLVEEILGEVVESYALSVVGADTSNQLRSTVSYVVKIRWYAADPTLYNMMAHDAYDIRTFGGVADVYPGNTDDMYVRYTSATAETRAEARALRKALRLKKTVAAEEITSKPVSESGIAGYIVRSLERGIDKMCRDMNINVLKFINIGKHQYKQFSQIRYTAAQGMLEELNRYLKDMDLIPEGIIGYDADWRSAS